jgi:hypothetical protein
VARVSLMSWLAQRYAGGVVEHDVPGGSVRDVVRALDERFPGLGRELEHGVAVAIDGEIYQNAFLEPIGPNSEVCFMPALEGG